MFKCVKCCAWKLCLTSKETQKYKVEEAKTHTHTCAMCALIDTNIYVQIYLNYLHTHRAQASIYNYAYVHVYVFSFEHLTQDAFDLFLESSHFHTLIFSYLYYAFNGSQNESSRMIPSTNLTPWMPMGCAHIVIKQLMTFSCILEYCLEPRPTHQLYGLILLYLIP